MKNNKYFPTLLFFFILIISLIPYRSLIGRGYSDVDDYKEIYRAIVEDIPQPADIFLTPHQGDRYRPINRLLTATTVLFGNNQPEAFVIRNLILHSICVLLVFLIIKFLTKNLLISSLGCLFFALHPANVNAVSVNVFTQVFGTSLVLFIILMIVLIEQDRSKNSKTGLYVLNIVFLLIINFSSEMFAWTIPTFMLYLAWKYIFRDRKSAYLILELISFASLIFYILIRQSIVTNAVLLVVSSSDRYGVQSLTQIAKNIGMFIIGMGNIWDYIYFINPIYETIPTTVPEIIRSGVWFSLSISFSFFFATMAGGIILFFQGLRTKEGKLALPIIFLILSLFSVSVVATATLASETYLHLANALLAISQALIFAYILSNYKIRQSYALQGVLILLFVAILTSRGIATDYRNLLLQDKAERIEQMQLELRENTNNFSGTTIVFSPVCSKQSRGFSVYGADGLDLVGGSEKEFVSLTLNRYDLQVEIISSNKILEKELKDSLNQRIIWIDNQGHMARQSNSPKLTCN